MKSLLFKLTLGLVIALSTELFAINGVGVLTITNPLTPRVCVVDSDGVILDPGLQISYDVTVPSSYVRSWTNLSTKTYGMEERYMSH